MRSEWRRTARANEKKEVRGVDVQEFLSRLHVESHNSKTGGYICRCPACDGSDANLMVNCKPSKYGGAPLIVFQCHAGCSTADVLNAMGLTVQDLRNRADK